MLLGGSPIAQVNNRFAQVKDRPKGGGWADIVVYLFVENPECKGLVAEVQIVHNALYMVRENLGQGCSRPGISYENQSGEFTFSQSSVY